MKKEFTSLDNYLKGYRMSRRLLIRCFPLFVLLIFVTSLSQAQWVPTAGPEGGSVVSLDVQGASVLATLTSGIFLSTDQGISWSPYNEGITDFANNFSKGIFFNGIEMLVSSYRAGLLVRQIGGASWQAQNAGLPGNYIAGLGFHGGTLFASPQGFGIYRSSNSGTSWIKADSGLDVSTTANQFLSDGPSAWAATTTGVYRSTDDGFSWTAKNNGLGCTYAWSITKVVSTYMCGTCDGLYISTDGGDSWTKKASGIDTPTYYGFAETPAGVFAASVGGVSMSTDTGATWITLKNGLPFDYYSSIKSIGSKLLLSGSFTGVFASTDDGLSWVPSNAGLRVAVTTRLLAQGTGIVAGAGSGLFRSTNDGASWSAIHPRGIARSVYGIAADNLFLYSAVSLTYNTIATYRSSDGGANWDSVQTGLPIYLGMFEMHTIGSTLYAATTVGLYSSTDHGSMWTSSGAPVGTIPTRGIDGRPDLLFAATSKGVYVSTDSGGTWTKKIGGLSDTNMSCINYFEGYVLAGTYSHGVFRSTDSGATWGSSGSIAGPNGFANVGQTTFLTSYYGLRRSTDHGISWSYSATGLTDSASYGIAEQNGYLFLATGSSGVWKRLKDELVTGIQFSGSENLPGDFALGQNFPNPFNPTTKINYAIHDAGFVTLKVFDLLGREVATLVNEVQQPGTHGATWDASSIGSGTPSGVYFYRLQIRPVNDARGTTFIETKKLILMK